MAEFVSGLSQAILLIIHIRFIYVNKMYMDNNPELSIRDCIKGIFVIVVFVLSMLIVTLLAN